jgi:hypothetical protein
MKKEVILSHVVLLSSYVAEFLNGPRPCCCCCCCWLKVPRAVMARLLLWLLVLLPRNEFDRFHLTEKYYMVFQDEKSNAGCFKMRKLIQGVCRGGGVRVGRKVCSNYFTVGKRKEIPTGCLKDLGSTLINVTRFTFEFRLCHF